VGRYVLGWRLSTLLDVSFCIEALEEVLSKERPEVFEERCSVREKARWR
jgi:hypothetical protein